MIRYPRLQSTVINIRGCNGSGKTHVVRTILGCFGNRPIEDSKGEPWAYEVFFEPRLYVLGNYEEILGGCDKIATIQGVTDGVRHLAEMGNVLFEGILVSILTEPWIQLAKSMPDMHFIFGTLDTPADVCVERVKQRREKQGLNGHWRPDNLLRKYEAVHHAHQVLKVAGLDVRRLPHKLPENVIVNWMLENAYVGGSK